MKDLTKQVIGNYRVGALLGTGGMGQVYEAEHLHLNKKVALKVMHDGFAADRAFKERFNREARAAHSLKHEHIIEIHDFGLADGRYYLVMELAGEGSLRALLQQRSRQQQGSPLARDLDLIRQTAQGLAHAHGRDIVHRDIKPDNLLLVREGGQYVVKIADFGLVRLAEQGQITTMGAVHGTPAYMSPEQCQGLPLDGRSDLYALGVVLFEVATGYLPFETKTLSEAVHKHVYTAPPAPRDVRGDLPASLEEVILRCLEKKPEARYAGAEELERTLDRVISEIEGALLSPTVYTPETIVHGPEVPVDAADDEERTASARARVTPAPDVESLAGSSPLPRVRVIGEDGGTLRVAELQDVLVLGRDAGSDIVLESSEVSRRHACIERKEGRLFITDLGSQNGTTVGRTRLLPNDPQVWAASDMARLGPYWLRVEPAREAPGVPDASADVEIRAASESSRGSRRIGIVAEHDSLELTPGQPQTLAVTLANLGTRVDHFGINVEGVPEDWVSFSEPVVQLYPKDHRVVTLSVAVPREPASRAGTYDIEIRATSRDNEDESARASGRWTVRPYHATDVHLMPERVRTRKKARYTLAVWNEGNASAAYSLSATDDQEVLRFKLAQASVNLEPGAAHQTEVTAEAARLWFGSAIHRTVTVRAEPQPSGKPLPPATAQFVQRPLIPRWAPPLVLAALAVLAFLAFTFTKPAIQASLVPESPLPGDKVSVVWEASRASQVEIKELGVIKKARDAAYAFVVGPDAPAELTVVAHGRFFGRTAQAKVPLALGAKTPQIVQWDVQPREVTRGGAVTLSWDVQDAERMEIAPLGTVSEASGSQTHTPLQSRAYTLAAFNGDKRVAGPEIAVQVNDPPPGRPSVETFTISPAEIEAGSVGEIELTWSVGNADGVSIEPGLGAVGARGSRTIAAPGETTTYVLRAENEGETVDVEREVKVNAAPAPVVHFAATPEQFEQGSTDKIKLAWKTEHASELRIEPGVGSVEAGSGQRDIAAPSASTTYTLIAMGAGGTAREESTVRVTERAGSGSAADVFKLPVEDVFSIAGRGTFATGRVRSGSVKVGDPVAIVRPGRGNLTSVVTGIEKFRENLDEAHTGDPVGLLLRGVDKEDLDGGDVVFSKNGQGDGVSVVLMGIGSGSKIQVVKEVRIITRLGLRESNDLVDGAPSVVVQGVSREEGRHVMQRLYNAGAEVTAFW